MIADQLRKAVLQAAIQGKLTVQLPEDGDAHDLLEEIKAERERLFKEGKIKKEKSLLEVGEDEIPFDIPDNWCWVKLGNIVRIHGGKRIPVGKSLTRLNTGYKYIRVADMQNNTVLDTDIHYVTVDVYLKIKNYTISSNDVYITCAGSIGRVGTVPIEFNGANLTENADKLVFPNTIDEYWLVSVLESPFIQSQIRSITTQVGQPKLAIKRIENLVVPLLPSLEQVRVVNKINSIFASLDKLREDENKLNLLQKTFPCNIKSSILQAAIQGKLTEQLHEDGDALQLLEEIKAEKERLIQEGKMKKEKSIPDITEEEIPFDIPENWCWVRLYDLGMIVGGGTPKTEEKLNWDDGDIPWLTPADMKNVKGKYVKNGERFITKYGLLHSSTRLMPKGSVLFSSRAPIGYLAIADNPICTNQGFKSVVPHKQSMSEYIYYYLMAFTQEVQKLGSGTTFKEVSGTVMEKLIAPLPPLAEQQRIVACLEELLPLCDALE